MSTFFQAQFAVSLQGKTLLIPVVSSANVSQLAVDLLISTFSLTRIGVFKSKDLVPVIGAREDGQDGVTVPLELYGKDGLNFVVIQQRSPALKSRKQQFVDSMLLFIRESKFSSLLLLSGMDPIERTDFQMLTPTFHFIPETSPPLSTPLSNIQKLQIPAYTSPRTRETKENDSGKTPFIPSGGLTRRFLDAIPNSWPIPTAAILQFAMEGDNRADAHILAAVVARILNLNLDQEGWKQPSSWEVGLFGTGHDQTLYG